MPPRKATAERERVSVRGRRMRDEVILSPIDQIPQPPGGAGIEMIGAWAYYLRLDGATITDILTIYPNGGVPDIDDLRLRARYGENAEYYRQRQRRRGLEYIGQVLTEESMKRLVEIMEANREDECLFLKEEIEAAQDVAKTSDLPEVRNQARRRKRQLERRQETLLQPFDTDEVLGELKEIARGQMLAKVDPNILRVMRSMIGEVNDKLADSIRHFQQGRQTSGAPARLSSSGGDSGAEFEGKDHIDL